MAKEKEEKRPTLKDIKDDMLPKCEEYYQDVGKKFDEDDGFYELNFLEKLNLPEEFKNEGIVLPTARDMVDTFVDHIDLNNARVYVNKKGTSTASLEEAEMMRKFYLGVIYMTNVMSSISPWRVGAKHYAAHGLATFKTVWDADRWYDKPEKKEGESEDAYARRVDEWRAESHESLPIVIQAIHPKCALPDPETGGKSYVFEVRENSVYNVLERYPNWKNPLNRKWSDKAKQVSWWSRKFRCELIDEEPVLKSKDGIVPHNYGFVPYTFIDTGLGNVDATNDPVKRYVGILRYIFDLLIAESRNFSISDVVLKKTAWPWGTLEGPNTNAVQKIDQHFGTYTPLPDGVKLVPQTPQVPPQALNEHLYRTSDYISAHAAPRSVRGLSETGVRSAADRRLIIAEAASRYQYATEAFKHGTANVLIKCARLMKNVIPGDVRVWARTPVDEFDAEIKKDKMKEPFTCYVEFAPISEEDEYRRHDDLERLVASGIVTKRWSRTQMSNVDPIALEADEERERLLNDPNVQQVLSQYVAGRLAQAISKRSAAEGLAMGLPAAPNPQQGIPRQMTPPIPNRAQPGTAEYLQKNLEGMRSQTPMNANQGRGGGGNR